MDNVVSALLRPHASLVLAFVLATAVAATWLLRDRLASRTRMLLGFLLVVAIGLIAQVTLLRDAPMGACVECLAEWRTDRVSSGSVGTETLLNVLLFIPPAFLATLLWRHPWRVTSMAALLSLGIEVVQPLLGVGANDVLDVLANTIGAFIGAWMAWALGFVRVSVAVRRLDTSEAARVVGVAAVAVVVATLGSAWGADMRQTTVAERLERVFAGTSLDDYIAWAAQDRLSVEVFARGPAWPTDASVDETAAHVTFPTRFYLSGRCVIATWDHDGFSTEHADGQACGEPPGR